MTLEGLIGQCIPGAKILDLCEFGHTVMEASAAKLYTKKVDGKAVDRGVAFPICISVNDVVCNHSPLPTEETVGAGVLFHVLCVRWQCWLVCSKCFDETHSPCTPRRAIVHTLSGPYTKWITSLPCV